MNSEIMQLLSSFAVTLAPLVVFLTMLVHVLFAAGVARDCGRLEHQTKKTALVSPMVWVFATLLGGVLVAGVYWLMHHSTLSRET